MKRAPTRPGFRIVLLWLLLFIDCRGARIVAQSPNVAPADQAKADSDSDPVSQAYRAYLIGRRDEARTLFAKLPAGPQYPFDRVRAGLPADYALTPSLVVAKSPSGLLAVERGTTSPVSWRRVAESVYWIGAIGASERVAVTTDAVAGPSAERYQLQVLDGRTLRTEFARTTGLLSEVNAPAVSADGRWIVYVDESGRLRLLEVATAADAPQWQPKLPAAEMAVIELAPNAERLFVGARHPAAGEAPFAWLALLEVPSGRTLWQRQLGAGERSDSVWAFSADGAWLALADGTGRRIELLATQTAKPVAQTKLCARATTLAFTVDGALSAYDQRGCLFHLPDLTPSNASAAMLRPRAGAPPELPFELAARLAARFCFDGRVIFPSDMRPCGNQPE